MDTGSLLTWIPKEILEAVGVKLGRKKFRTIERKIIERDVGETLLELMGEKATRLESSVKRVTPKCSGLKP